MANHLLYHGSDHIVQTPVFGEGRARNDYGVGFYCTEHFDMAKEWAVEESQSGYANSYALDDDGLTLLNLNGDDYTTLHWLATLLQNRTFDLPAPLPHEARDYLIATFPVPYAKADVIRGYRADDSYFSFAQDFLNGLISLQQLERAMRLGNLGEQIVIKSPAAFERLSFRGAEFVTHEEWYPQRAARDHAARSAYFDRERNRRNPSDLFILQILDEEMKPDDPRLR